MKKFLAIFAAAAVVGTAGYAIVKNEQDKANPSGETESTSYSQSDSGNDSTEKTVGNKSNDSSSVDNQNSQTDVSNEPDEKESTFIATINSYTESVLMVTPDKGTAESKSADKFSVNISKIKLVDEKGKEVKSDDVKNLAKAKITYKGGIQETYPAGITAIKVVLTGRVNCNVYFSVNGNVVRTLNVGVGSSIEESDMPNAGAYCEDGYHFDGWYVDSKKVAGLTNITDSVTVVAKISKD